MPVDEHGEGMLGKNHRRTLFTCCYHGSNRIKELGLGKAGSRGPKYHKMTYY